MVQPGIGAFPNVTRRLAKRLVGCEQNKLVRQRAWPDNAPAAPGACTGMKAKIVITPKKAVLDPQGKTVQTALEHMGYEGVNDVHVGKYLEIELEGDDAEAWKPKIDEACHKLLSNPVIEDYHFTIE
ncbi:MAG: phosphoribosylformylglycinamidine synthase subunit PurS [Verrucomicrobiales bacterium]|nr:phosphoribosylformylglycinamidine synthase subunit PurS [Verrucomicrobiales bacterium]